VKIVAIIINDPISKSMTSNKLEAPFNSIFVILARICIIQEQER
jgi:hypothetical protein